jgi:hypothetical protein
VVAFTPGIRPAPDGGRASPYAPSTADEGTLVSNVQTVESIYAAFGRGDIPAILARLAEDVEWDVHMSDIGVPWLRPLRGRSEVPQFFQSLGALEFRRFEPKTLLENGDVVVAIIGLTVVVKSTGRTIVEEDEMHIWRFDRQGRVQGFSHKVDTHQHWLAFRG